ncbi:hypothetical protein CEXT_261501 [Caerostris extrusa]|uniref:Uncharacterized protein n=1 Tax=Caerostris extrusa TaxID=172846 RepID=A0AAV4SMQ2_CAEEX|nr:hypothetical protein CEXT_261501 [Caerostris extrusa]
MIKEEKESQNWMTMSAKATRSRNSFLRTDFTNLLVSAQQLELLIEISELSEFGFGCQPKRNVIIKISELSELGFGSSQLIHNDIQISELSEFGFGCQPKHNAILKISEVSELGLI